MILKLKKTIRKIVEVDVGKLKGYASISKS